MTTLTSFKFKLTGVTGTPFDARTKQNVKKRISNVLYLESPPDDAVLLSYVGSKEISPQSNLFIGDRSTSIYANSKNNRIEEFVSFSKTASVPIASTSLLVTQEFVEAESGYLPLYFKHILTSLVIPESVKVYDSKYNFISEDKWKLVPQYEWDEDTGDITSSVSCYNLFNSLENLYDPVQGTYEVYFVQYTASVSGTQSTYTVLLNNEKAYKEATYEDYWFMTPGELKPWTYSYAIADDGGSVTLPAVKKIAVKYIESQRISVKPPVDYTDRGPWFPRIVNGSFSNGLNGLRTFYHIPEFQNQAFNPLEPYKIAARQECQKIDTRLVKLAHEDIQTGAAFNSVNLIFEKDSIVEYAITTDPFLDNTAYLDFSGSRVYDSDNNEIRWSTADLLSLDRRSGIVLTNFDISDSHNVYGYYSYKENYYTLTSLMMSPVFDQTVHKQIRIIYLVPRSIYNNNLSEQVASVMWLKVSKSGIIEDTNQDPSTGNESLKFETKLSSSSGYKLSGIINMHYSWTASTVARGEIADIVEVIPGEPFSVESTQDFPAHGWLRAKDEDGDYRYFRYTSKTDTEFNLSLSTSEVPNETSAINIPEDETVELVNFIEERSTLSSRDYSDEVSSFGAAGFLSLASQYFILAEMVVNPPHSIKDLSVIDIREDGGGIDEKKYLLAKKINPQIQWFNDIETFDGQPYPTNAVVVIKLPSAVLEDFSLDNIRNIVKEKVGFGVFPLIRFYGYEPRIIRVVPGAVTSSIRIDWEKEGIEFVYNIWYASNEKGPWVKASPYFITDGDGSYNTFTIEGLSENKSYFVKITMHDRYYSWWYGYSGANSIEGGLGLDTTTPVAPFGNNANFQFLIT